MRLSPSNLPILISYSNKNALLQHVGRGDDGGGGGGGGG